MNLVQIQTGPKPKATGPKYWRSLEELANTPEFRKWVAEEFPSTAPLLDGQSRRSILKVMAASFGLAGLAACSRPELRLAPQARTQFDYVPGASYNYTSAFVLNGHASGLLVETYDGRPVKIEGNPDHPDSRGAATALAQASVLDVYDPDRAQRVMNGAEESSWQAFEAWAAGLNLGDGTGLRFLSEPVNSPTLENLRQQALARYPNAAWVEYESISRENERQGTMIAFGQALQVHHHFDRAKVILSLDYDFLGADYPTPLATKRFSERRRAHTEEDLERLSRLYVVESQFSLTGARAEHRLRMRGSGIRQFAQDLRAALSGAAAPGSPYLSAVVADLRAAGAEGLVVAGPRQPAVVHALAHQINSMIGSGAVTYTAAPAPPRVSSGLGALRALTEAMNAGQVTTLIVLGGNPAYTAPADLQFGAAMAKVANSIYLGTDVNETSAGAKWNLPEAHYLEAWGDARASNGIASVQQPMIEPLYGGKSAIEVLAILLNLPQKKGLDIVKSFWTAQWQGTERQRENIWRKALNDGVLPGAPAAEVRPALNAAAIEQALAQPAAAAAGIEVAFVPSAATWDGRFANNGWMQETPDPITKLVWDNAVLISPATAREQGLATGDMVAITKGNLRLEAAVMVQPGQADNSVAIALGYGRQRVGRVGTGVGFNANLLRTTDGFWYGEGFAIQKVAGTHVLATTQEYGRMEEPEELGTGGHHRPVYREATVGEFRREPGIIAEMAEVPELESLHPFKPDYSQGYQWGMSIDLNACTGCNACVVACQAENNTPVVGKDQVLRGREMHWLRVDRYYVGDENEPRAVEQPIPCMQCENAPCEYVCPVAATTHSSEGLNDMAYNRCVGTRYCANNCPFKVRHFNFLNFHKNEPELMAMVYNPEVTVRMRGIMEKCTYCVQRIQAARITAKVNGRRQIEDGDILTACQQTCPADAIVFGNINDPNSRVSQLKRQERNYAMLAELNIRPRTTYLGRIRNVNPALEPAGEEREA
jgi:MoCo/4Fe-4S cofactor protein with predicted Tat translocation signal